MGHLAARSQDRRIFRHTTSQTPPPSLMHVFQSLHIFCALSLVSSVVKVYNRPGNVFAVQWSAFPLCWFSVLHTGPAFLLAPSFYLLSHSNDRSSGPPNELVQSG